MKRLGDSRVVVTSLWNVFFTHGNTTRTIFITAVFLAQCLFSGCSVVENAPVHQQAAGRFLNLEVERFKQSSNAKHYQHIDDVTSLFEKTLNESIKLKNLKVEIDRSAIDIEQSRSVTLPRADVVIGANTTYDKDEGWESKPEYGLVFRYNINEAIFKNDAVAVTVAEANILQLQYELLSKQILCQTSDLLVDHFYEDLRIGALTGILEIEQKLISLSEVYDKVLPSLSTIDVEDINHSILLHQQQLIAAENDRNRLRRSLELESVSRFEPLLLSQGSKELLRTLQYFVEENLRGQEFADLFQKSVEIHPAYRILESRLFISKMKKLGREREKLPQIRASLGGGSFLGNGSEETSDLVFKLNVRMPLFDAGDIDRRIKAQKLAVKKTENEVLEDIRHRYFEMNSGFDNIHAIKKQCDILEEGVRSLEQRYNRLQHLYGDRNPDEVLLLLTARELHTAQISLYELEHKYLKALVSFLRISALSYQFQPFQPRAAQAGNH